LEAIAFKEQQTMPLVGASIDRRTFQHIAADLSEDAVRSMVCMCCARVATSMNGCTGIAMIKASLSLSLLRPKTISSIFHR
jgi:hypothetical protein